MRKGCLLSPGPGGDQMTQHRETLSVHFAQLSPVSTPLRKTCLDTLKKVSEIEPLGGVMQLAQRLPQGILLPQGAEAPEATTTERCGQLAVGVWLLLMTVS